MRTKTSSATRICGRQHGQRAEGSVSAHDCRRAWPRAAAEGAQCAPAHCRLRPAKRVWPPLKRP
eukprot:1820292-Alexandrium_andersonii.AAC.1